MSTITVGTSAGSAFSVSSDTTGALVLKTNNDTTALTLGTDQVATFAAGVSAPSVAATTVSGAISGTTGSFSAQLVVKPIVETVTLTGSWPASTQTYDVLTQSIQYYTSFTLTNWTINLRGNSSTSMDSLLSVGQSVTVALMVTNSGTAYYNTSVQVDGTTSGVTTKWQGGTAPSSGNASATDVYTYTIIKTGSATFTVLASQTKFA